MKLKIKKAFDWAHGGVDVESFAPGQEIETDDQELIDVAVREGWVTQPGRRGKAKAGADDVTTETR